MGKEGRGLVHCSRNTPLRHRSLMLIICGLTMPLSSFPPCAGQVDWGLYRYRIAGCSGPYGNFWAWKQECLFPFRASSFQVWGWGPLLGNRPLLPSISLFPVCIRTTPPPLKKNYLPNVWWCHVWETLNLSHSCFVGVVLFEFRFCKYNYLVSLSSG